jgi:putative flavoprotein involved in K+ transport
MHSTGDRDPRDIPAGTVLVVGGGNTGFQIAAELTGTHAVHLSVGSRQTPLPQKVWQRDLFWWLTKTGLLNMTVDSRLGRRLSERETLIGSSPKQLRRLGVDLHPRAVSVSDTTVSFADGTDFTSTRSYGQLDTSPTTPGSRRRCWMPEDGSATTGG